MNEDKLLKKYNSYIGKVIGNFTILEIVKVDKNYKKFFKCKCSCGNIKVLRYENLNKSNKGCGCKRGLKYGESSFNYVFYSYKKSARYRNINFKLTKNQFKILTQKNCHYCNCKPIQISQVGTNKGTYLYNGLDRIDNSKGYTLDNVLPCCKRDNWLRNNEFTVKETEIMVKALESFRRK